MKKRMLSGLLCVMLAATMISGCAKSDRISGSDAGEDSSGEETAGEDDGAPVMPPLDDIDLEKSITLGEYKGITVEKQVTAVTDDMIDTEVAYSLSTAPMEVTDENAKVETGDTANIDYVGKVDGKEFEGGSAEGMDLGIGSGQFIDGFEDGLIGSTKGQTLDLNLKFPEGYSEELGGKDVVFTVTVNTIKRPLTEISDEWVAANSEYKTIAEYRESVRKNLEDFYENTATEGLSTTAWQQVVSTSTVNEYPEELTAYGEATFEYQIQTFADGSSQTLDEYLEAQGVSKEDYEEQKSEYGKNVATQMLVMKSIADKEKFSTEDEEYKEILKGYMEQTGLEEDAFFEEYGKENIYQSIMLQRVTQFIVDNAEIKEVPAETADENTEAADENAEEAAE